LFGAGNLTVKPAVDTQKKQPFATGKWLAIFGAFHIMNTA
jgi:hypothetical protein